MSDELIHGIDFVSHNIGCGANIWENNILITGDVMKITCEPCRVALIKEEYR